MYEDQIVDLLGWRRAKIGTGPRIQFRRAPRGQRKQGDGRCCLALHVTIPLNRNFQSWRWGFLLLPPSTVHTRLCASIFDGQCHFSQPCPDEREMYRQARTGSSGRVRSIRGVMSCGQVALHRMRSCCLSAIHFHLASYKELQRSILDLVKNLR
ncbi:hypothetical protein D6C85_07095 [Aureobasidium pullulans]|uniref:Uncharacterized protein n=1 Tax=Aureobasidium pullulans TaxID=5580 RepID=A0A4V4KXD1_AURPU|nr:hypothetical protein D6C85_07095 [Aureobasidium pullulans]